MRNEQTTYLDNISHKLTITSTGAQRTSAMSVQMPVFRIAATVDCWYRVGSSTVTATSTGNASHFLTAGTILFANKDMSAQYVSVIANSASGIAVVTGQTL